MKKSLISLKDKLKYKQQLSQLFSQIPSSLVTEILSNSPIDALCFDNQHGQFNVESLRDCIAMCVLNRIPSLVRIPENQHLWSSYALDAGASGIICPLINNAEECERFVKDCLYPPLGCRSSGPFIARLRGDTHYMHYANDEVVTLAMIETQEGVKHLDAILEVEHLSGIYIGPLDLSETHPDLPPFSSIFSRELKELILEIGKKALAKNKLFCVHCTSPEQAVVFYQHGAHLCNIGNDIGMLQQTSHNQAASINTHIAKLRT